MLEFNIMKLIIFAFLTLLAACSHFKEGTPTRAPYQEKAQDSIGEQDIKDTFDPSDNKWWNALSEVAEKKGLVSSLKTYYPHLYKQLQSDARDPYLLMFWGESKNQQGNLEIIPSDIRNELMTYFHRPIDSEHAHAGIIHAYGYLFSRVQTDYGHKRERWIFPPLKFAFEFRNNELSPETTNGTLLSNLTYFAGSFAFENTNELQLIKNVSNDLKTFNYEQYKKIVILEKTPRYHIRTTLIAFPGVTKDLSHLLIYTYYDTKTGKENLVTAYPIGLKSFQKYRQKKNSKKTKIILRNNLYLDVAEADLVGSREIIE